MSERAQIPAKPTAAPAQTLKPAPTGVLRRKCACGGAGGSGGDCADCKKKKLQRRAAGQGPQMAPPIVHDVLRSPGQPLDAATRSYFEPRFRHDFSRVRVHADARASESARSVNALAYTVGSEIVFGAGQYRPNERDGKRLLAHELTHVVQQKGEVPIASPLQVGPSSDSFEQEADRRASSVMEESFDGTALPDAGMRKSVEDPLQREAEKTSHGKRSQPSRDARVQGHPPSKGSGPSVVTRASGTGLSHEEPQVSRSSSTPILRRKCLEEVGPTPAGCNLVSPSVVAKQSGERFLFNVNCDDFAPGEKERLVHFSDPKVTAPGSEITVIGMASSDGPKDLNQSLACHRASAAVEVLTAQGRGPKIREVAAAGGVPGTEHSAKFRSVEVRTQSDPSDACPEGPVNQDKDPLPSVPPFTFTVLPADQVLQKVKAMQPPGQPIPQNPPLGASQPTFQEVPVKVSSVPVPNSSCVKCVAEWDVTPKWQAFISSGPIDSNEPKRFAAFREGDGSGCPPHALPVLLPVRRVVTPAALPRIIAAEKEHYNDFVRAFQLVGGRYLSNVRRLTPERTHLRAQNESECREKVSDFLFDARGFYFHFFVPFLERYTRTFAHDFTTEYNRPDRDRRGGPHQAIPNPPTEPIFKPPVFPNIDVDRNPFGCNAFFRKYDAGCVPGVPGPASDALIKETDQPLKHPWHAL